MKEKIVCAVSYLWVLFFLPLVLLPGNSFGKFHANQALLNLILGLLCTLAIKLLGWIPIVGWIVRVVLGILMTVFVLWGIITSLTGQERPFPVIGEIHILD